MESQRQLCEAFIASQAGEGWAILPTVYDDGGSSGASLDRPAVQRLLVDVAAGQVDIVVVYKIDRLSRSLVDFASLFGRFEAQGVDFVAVTQAFNTTSSMGRLTLNVLLSFAQFERELASERLRDKAAASRAKGLWQTGQRPFGYRVDKGYLIVVPNEAETVRYVFRRYLRVRSTRLLAEELERKGIRNKVGTPFTGTAIANMLRNRLYRGDLVHKGQALPGLHEPIITERVWLTTRRMVEQVALEKRPANGPCILHPFKGLMFGTEGQRYTQNWHVNRYGTLYRYYMPSGRQARYGKATCGRQRFKADVIDDAILAASEPFIPMAARARDRAARSQALRSHLLRIDIGEETLTISLKSEAVIVTPLTGRIRVTKPWGGKRHPVHLNEPRPAD